MRGWRTSLEDVRRFTFVDERGSYAARTGRANGKMGWIQAWAYRERYAARVSPPRPVPWDRQPYEEPEARSRQEGAAPAARDKADAPPAETKDEAPESRAADGKLQKRPDGLGGYPGTGWELVYDGETKIYRRVTQTP